MNGCRKSVSILILLEVILEASGTSSQSELSRGFNPYFTGSNSGSLPSFLNLGNLSRVSILILLEVILEVIICLIPLLIHHLVSILILLEVILEVRLFRSLH